MTPPCRDVAIQALFSIQIIAIILKRLGEGETPVDPAAVKWLGDRLEESYETAEHALMPGRLGGAE